uniref:Basic helix-loop-helix ARNT like 2 n=1 Tax=Gasterosteus aculeatus aculeatus TaxID=481459 RepID=A0AAQ4S8J9_GASAC
MGVTHQQVVCQPPQNVKKKNRDPEKLRRVSPAYRCSDRRRLSMFTAFPPPDLRCVPQSTARGSSPFLLLLYVFHHLYLPLCDLCLHVPTESQKFCTVHCTGYIRSWPASHFGAEGEGEADEQDSSHFSYLMAMGRVHSHSSPQLNGEVCVKPTTTILGYLPQELLGTSCYEYFHQDDLPPLIRPVFVLWSKDKIETNCYKFKTKCGSFVTLQSQWFSFVNPWTKEVEYIVNTSHPSSNYKTCDEDGRKSHPVVPGTSDFKIYAGSIGAQIAKELLDYNRMNTSPSCCSVSPFSRPRDKCPQTHNPISNNVISCTSASLVYLSQCSSIDKTAACFSDELKGNSQLDSDCVVGPGLSNLSGDEAAMAVFMSLLETDTNPGEAADIQEMHWSL